MFDLVTADAKFAGTVDILTPEIIEKYIVEAMNVLHYDPPSATATQVGRSLSTHTHTHTH